MKLEPLDRRLRPRLASVTASINASIVLDGKTQSEARAARFLRRARRRGAKFILVTTGKCARADGSDRILLRRRGAALQGLCSNSVVMWRASKAAP